MGIGSYIYGYKEDDMPSGDPMILTEEQKERNDFFLNHCGKALGKKYDESIIDCLFKQEDK